MPRFMIVVDECPVCKYDLGQIAFKRRLMAGDDITCPQCGEELYVGEYHEGTQSYYTFNIG